jgi:DNA-directed RNA polymerase subunit RPC12/RpoP
MDMRENPNYYFNCSRYKSKYICTDCRKSFKRKILADVTIDKNIEEKNPKCPDCGKSTDWIGPKFRAPKTENIKAWKSIKALHDIGLLHSIGWANNYFEIPETTKALKDFLKDLKVNYEWSIKKWATNEYSSDNKIQIKHFSEAIKKIEKHLKTK